jgi:hypothetical protein
MARERLSKFNVVATYADMEAARRAMSALERAGVDGDDISLLGRRADEAATATETSERDAHLAGDVGRRTLVGGAAGAAVGAAAGAVAFAIPGVGPAIGAGIWATTLGGAVGGGAVGGVVGGISSLDLSDDWELTYDDVRAGRVLVAAHTDDADEADRLDELLQKESPRKVERFDAAGKRLAA